MPDDLDPDDGDEGDAVHTNVEAPVTHLTSNARNILVDAPFGSGRIVILSDPYVVSNGGISLVDNAQFAVNIVSNGTGIIAFDEYHHGYGGNTNRLFEFFAGTPVDRDILSERPDRGTDIFFEKPAVRPGDPRG